MVATWESVAINTSGNPRLATAGSGDVLSGLIGALLAQGMSGFSAAAMGAFVHGVCGDRVQADRGTLGVIASDIVETLPHVLGEIERAADVG